MPNQRNIQTVAELNEKMSRVQFAVVANYRGMTVDELSELRNRMRPKGAEVIVAKNTLLRIAARENGLEAIEPLLEGPTSVLFVYDDVAETAKLFNQYLKEQQKLEVRGGLLGKTLLQPDSLVDVEKLPSRMQVLAQIVGGIQSPLAGLVGVLNAPVADLVGVLQAVPGELVGVLQARITQLQEGEAGAPA